MVMSPITSELVFCAIILRIIDNTEFTKLTYRSGSELQPFRRAYIRDHTSNYRPTRRQFTLRSQRTGFRMELEVVARDRIELPTRGFSVYRTMA